MKQFILIDKNNLCQCIATERCNLHQSKINKGMQIYCVDKPVYIGDEVQITKLGKYTITPRPENYPQLSEADKREQKIQTEIRQMAIERLTAKGEI